MLTFDIPYLYTKFDDSSFSHSRDMIGAPKNFNGHVTWSRPCRGWFVICGLRLTTIKLPAKLEISIFTHYEHVKGSTGAKCRKWVVWNS